MDTPEGREALEGTINPRHTFDRLVTHADERLPGVFFVNDASFWDGIDHVYFSPGWTPSADPDAWQFYDGLFVELRDARGAILGNLSVDDPDDRRRPCCAASVRRSCRASASNESRPTAPGNMRARWS